MYNEVLKYGSYIVDALVKYEQPVFVYIPPFGELRGGSWVVVDPTINPDFMEMYADQDARGGVLEPEGIVNIKYRRDKQLETMARLDPEYAALRKQIADKSLSQEEQSNIKVKMTAREQLLLPVYMQISLQFADLHDRAGRMKAKGVIRQALVWREARRFFYWRVRRRVNEEYILKRMAGASKNPLASRARNLETLAAWTGVPNFAASDREVAMWYEENRRVVHEKVEALKAEGVAFDVAALLRANGRGALKGVQQVLSMLPAEEREEAIKYLSQA
jgi:acetyl-CoA carboxylase/biotin carboxylase 1